jgi:LAS superfamily LD-carboxypeptidase LdcB
MAVLNPQQLTGQDEDHLVTLPCGNRLQQEVAFAFAALQADARAAGFELAIASSYRSFARQLAIWNGKARGERMVHDDSGQPIAMSSLAPQQRLHAILRFSAIPGSSRHHWGTDLDVFDAAALPADYRLQLSPQEVAPGGMFDALHRWLDRRMKAGESHGFFRPYAHDRGGVAPERWHLSYAPMAAGCELQLNRECLLACWDDGGDGEELLLRAEIEAELPAILARYVQVAEGWCPAGYRP